jgi:hypothetical protein
MENVERLARLIAFTTRLPAKDHRAFAAAMQSSAP